MGVPAEKQKDCHVGSNKFLKELHVFHRLAGRSLSRKELLSICKCPAKYSEFRRRTC